MNNYITALSNLDKSLLLSIYYLPHPSFLVEIFKIITYSSNEGAIWAVILLLYLIIKRKNLQSWVYSFSAFSIWAVVNEYGLKYIFLRKRPFFDVHIIPYLKIPPLDPSFPSGHSFISFYTAVYISCNIKNKWMKVLLYTFAVLVTFSRVYLGVHYPSDIVGGALIGAGFAGITIIIERWIFSKAPPVLMKSNRF